MSVTSIVTPRGTSRTRAKLNGSTAATPAATPAAAPRKMTLVEACKAAFEYGQNIAGQDGTLTIAFKTFASNEKALDEIEANLIEGYYVKKADCDRDEAKRVIGLAKYNKRNPENNTDKNRTKAQQNILTAADMLVSRAKRMAGITAPVATPDPAKEAEAARKEAEAKAHQDRLIKADQIVNPQGDDVDVFDSLNRLVLAMKALQRKYTTQLVDDRGSEWREWLANAPR